jgi:cob(I)alamin adenosyltransferase
MVTLNRIYTRTGDDGTTRLATGQPVSKSDLRVAAYGEVDEANACLGLARLHTQGAPLDAVLGRLQNELFDLGADLATPPRADEAPGQALRILDSQVDRLESEIDALNADLPELKSFILPGGTPAAAALHLARTVARRAERATVRPCTWPAPWPAAPSGRRWPWSRPESRSARRPCAISTGCPTCCSSPPARPMTAAPARCSGNPARPAKAWRPPWRAPSPAPPWPRHGRRRP